MIITGAVRRCVLAGALAAAAGLVAGCGGGSGTGAARTLAPLPSATTPNTTAGTTAGTAAPAVTTTTPAAVHAGPPPRTAFTRQGAEQFARAYYLTANQAMASGRVQDLLAYSLPECPCRAFARDIAGFTRKGQHIRARGYVIKAVTGVPLVGNAIPIAVTFSLDNLRVFDAAGHQVDGTSPIPRETDTVLLVRQRHRWWVQRIIGGPQR